MEFYVDGNKFGEVSGESIKNSGLDGKYVSIFFYISYENFHYKIWVQCH